MTQVWAWLQSLFLLPGDTLIARLAPTPLGALLDLTPKHLGSNVSAALSTAVWLFGIWAVYGAWAFLMDVADPTYRAQRRERRQAQAAARRAYKQRRRALYRERKHPY
jgi:hypothetical protein